MLLRTPVRLGAKPLRRDMVEPRRSRLGITVSRKVGNAVMRNYIKRSVREWFRMSRNLQEPGDLVVIVRRDASQLHGSRLIAALNELLEPGGSHHRENP